MNAAISLRQLLIVLLGLLLPVAGHAGELLLVGHPKSPVEQLMPNDVKRIYVGAMRAFPETQVFILVADQPAESETYRQFYSAIFGKGASKIRHRRAAYLFGGQGVVPRVFDDDAAVKAYVAKNPSAIGYISASNVDESVKVLMRLQTP